MLTVQVSGGGCVLEVLTDAVAFSIAELAILLSYYVSYFNIAQHHDLWPSACVLCGSRE